MDVRKLSSLLGIFLLVGFVEVLSEAAPAKGAVKSPEFQLDTRSETEFVNLMCGKGEYFRECFSTSKEKCMKDLRAETQSCKASVQAKKLKMKSEVQLFAEIGICAGDGLEKKWRDRKANNSKCDNKENWR